MLRSLVLGTAKSLTRVTSIVSKEITEVTRRPGTLLSLVLGPFLILALFGIGYNGQRRPLDTVVVVPAEADLPRDPAVYQRFGGEAVRVVGVTSDLEAARTRLRRQEIDLVVSVPPDAERTLLEGHQAEISIEYNQIDPVRDNYARFVAYRQVQELNRAIIEAGARQGQEYLVQRVGAAEATRIPPEVIAAPTRAETKNWAPITPEVIAYFGPAVLALVLQHMGITLTALSLVRERLSGVFEIFRVSPVRTLELLVGKYLAYTFLNLAIALVTTLTLVGVLGIPLLGNLYWLAGIIALLTVGALGVGLLISVVVQSEREAVQLAMLVLLASVFFSGFVLPLDEFALPMQWLAYALPVTHGIRLLQDFMLRGGSYALWEVWALGGIALALFLFTAARLRRALAPA